MKVYKLVFFKPIDKKILIETVGTRATGSNLQIKTKIIRFQKFPLIFDLLKNLRLICFDAILSKMNTLSAN